MQSYTELRRDITALADDLNVVRNQYRDLIHELDMRIAKLIEYADKITTKAFDERDEHGDLLARFKSTEAKKYKSQKPNPAEVAEGVALMKKRNCSLCGKPGHRKDNCPDANKAFKAARAEEPLKPGQRACSICRKPGHRSTTCPQKKD